MIPLVIYTVAVFGLAYVIGHAEVTRALRETLHDGPGPLPRTRRLVVVLMECPACLGFWLGLGFGLWAPPLAAVSPLSLAFYTCGSNLLLARYVGIMRITD